MQLYISTALGGRATALQLTALTVITEAPALQCRDPGPFLRTRAFLRQRLLSMPQIVVLGSAPNWATTGEKREITNSCLFLW